MSRNKAEQLTESCVGMVRALLATDDTPAKYPWLDHPEQVGFSELIGAIRSLAGQAAGRDLSHDEPVEILGGFAETRAPRKTPAEVVAQHPRRYPPDRMPADPLQHGISELIDTLGAIMVDFAAAGVPMDEHLEQLEYWQRRLRPDC